MIRFFRSIRQGLVNKGQTSKYFRYAVGEVFLVVLGILIALQINTWNGERMDAQLEQHYIERLIHDMEQDIEEINVSKDLAELRLDFAELLIGCIEDPEIAGQRPVAFLAAVDQSAYTNSPTLNSDTFEQLRSTGNLALLSDSLAAALYAYYRQDEIPRQYVPLDHMIEFKHFELNTDVLTVDQAIWVQDNVGLAWPPTFDSVAELKVDESVVIEAAKRLSANQELVAWLPRLRHIQNAYIRDNSSRIKRAEELTELLKENRR